MMEFYLRCFCVKISQEFLILDSDGGTLFFGKTTEFIFVPKNVVILGRTPTDM
jgi:hypothetical protein